jgi:hypothetical protein
MKLLREVDPEGSKLRRRKRILRRTYHSFGPNHIWHVDGYVESFYLMKIYESQMCFEFS